MKKYRYKYCVCLNNNFGDNKVLLLKNKYDKWFNTKHKALLYARGIKYELKKAFKGSDNIITLDIEQYEINHQTQNEEYRGIVYSLNIVGKY